MTKTRKLIIKVSFILFAISLNSINVLAAEKAAKTTSTNPTGAKAQAPQAAVPAPEAPPPKPNFSLLTSDEIEIYQRGEIETAPHVIGGVIGTFIGFGTGHIVIQKYSKRGWIFTVGEIGSIAVMMAGVTNATVDCMAGARNDCSDGLGYFMLGALAFYGFRIWEIIDVWVSPGEHNRKYRAIKAKAESQGLQLESLQLLPLVAGGDAVLHPGVGLNLQLKF